jgi:hypothetical protein
MTEFVKEADGLYYAPPIDPEDELDYTMNFAGILGADTIASVLWSKTGDIEIITGSNTNTTNTATVWLRNGVVGEVYTITARVTSAGGRIIERSFRIRCLDQ